MLVKNQNLKSGLQHSKPSLSVKPYFLLTWGWGADSIQPLKSSFLICKAKRRNDTISQVSLALTFKWSAWAPCFPSRHRQKSGLIPEPSEWLRHMLRASTDLSFQLSST